MKIDFPKPEKMKDERYFQVRAVDSNGDGCYTTITVKGNTTEENIYKIACEEWTNEMLEKEERYMPSYFSSPPKWVNTIKVVEQTRTIEKLKKVNERTGRDYMSSWKTTRGGLKFTIVNRYIEVTFASGKKHRGNGYSFGRKQSN